MTLENLTASAIQLLKDLIEIPSFSSEEDLTAARIERWFQQYKIPFQRSQNNIWATNADFDRVQTNPPFKFTSRYRKTK